MKDIQKLGPNQTAPPNRRPRIPFVALVPFGYPVCAPPPCQAVVGEPCRSHPTQLWQPTFLSVRKKMQHQSRSSRFASDSSLREFLALNGDVTGGRSRPVS